MTPSITSSGLASRKNMSNRCTANKLAVAPIRRAFTLFELILAIALSVALLALIGTAINLYLLRVDVSRTRIEEAQLARSVLTMIADDLRATSVYKPQDTSGIASLVAASAKFDPDSIDNPSSGSGGGSGGNSGGGSNSGGGNSSGGSGFSTGGGAGSTGTAGGAGAAGGASMLGGGSTSATGSTENDVTLPLGVNGTMEELYVDVEHMPRLEELFRTDTGYTNAKPLATPVDAPFSTPPRPSNVRTVRYFIRQGRPLAPGSPAVTSLAPDQQLEIGGLVRQEIARPQRVWAEQSGDQTVLDSGQALVAPEVTHIEFRYFDGAQVVDYWDMKEKGMLPPAIEVRVWILASGNDEAAPLPGDLTSILARSHEYHQIVYLPTSAISTAAAASAMSGSTSGTSSSSTTSTTSSASSGSGSSFDQ
jgi:uncharacterized membrane protein YgcG